MASEEKIVVRQIGRPHKENADALLVWFCESLDLSGNKDIMGPEMLREIINGSMNGNGVTSKELNWKLNVPRTTVIYHLNRFIYSGIVIRRGRRYYLRSEDMKSTLQELQADMIREFQRMMDMAQKLDGILEDETYARRRRAKKG